MARSEVPEDFAWFWAQERDHVYRSVAFAVGDPSLASEAIDEAMTRALERWSKVGRYDRPAGWVYRVAVNWATSRRRRLALRPTRSREVLDRPITDELPDVDLARQLALLKPVQRSVVLLRF